MANKTLLVGLGGTGCEIVSRVKKKIGVLNTDIQYVGFDTDGEWEGTDGINMVYTSKEMTVREYLKDIDNWQEWFPDDAMLKTRNMLKGAGQVRPLSRLAFAETMSSNRLGELDDAIRKLKLEAGNVKPNSFRVMIVSSFAGGTGSGMFIQMALFLREYIKKNYAGDILVRGMFALPDLFMSSNINSIQRRSMYANAYGALKELNAINQVCLSRDKKADSINLTIDKLFDSKRDRLKAEKKPFDFIFFVDNVNSKGTMMKSLEEYKNLLVNATYMQVYSPVTTIGDSREDNLILSVINKGGRPLYGGVGTAKIVYPYKDIVDYCAMRATVDSIGSLWRIIDDEFEKAKKDNRKQMKYDLNTPPLNRGKHYISTVKDKLENDVARIRFIRSAMEMYNSAGSEEDDEEQYGGDTIKIDRCEEYFDNMTQYITEKIGKSEELSNLSSQTGVELSMLKKKENTLGAVTNNETALKNYFNGVNDFITYNKNAAIQSVFSDDIETGDGIQNNWNIISLLRINNMTVHPLSVRMLLYTLRIKIEERLSEVRSSSSSYRKRIVEYFKKAYDIKETKSVTETAEERASESGFFKRRNFAAEYYNKSGKIKKVIESYSKDAFMHAVLEGVLGRLNGLISQYERLFDNLEVITDYLNGKISEIENNPDHISPTGECTYVCSDPEEKRALYDAICFDSHDDNENPINDAVLLTLYKNVFDEEELKEKKKEKKLTKKEIKENEEKVVTGMKTLFINSVLKKNREDIEAQCSDVLDISVFEALKKETEGDIDQIKSRFIQSTFSKGTPYLLHKTARPVVADNREAPPADCSFVLTFWGISPEVSNDIQNVIGTAGLSDFFKGFQQIANPEVVVSDHYSRHEISCYEALYCVELREIPKFLEVGDTFGVYYDNYREAVDEMVNNNLEALTPHLDKRWYQRSYLPMISDDKNIEDDKMTARALWLAMIYGGLPEMTDGKNRVFFASFIKKSQNSSVPEQVYGNCDILYKGKRIPVNNPYELYKALQINEIVTRRFIEVYTPAFEEDKNVTMGRVELKGPRARRLAAKLISADVKTGTASKSTVSERNALRLIYRFISHAKSDDYEIKTFIDALDELIAEFCEELAPEKQAELRSLIYDASGFAKNKSYRESVERYLDLDYWKAKED